MIFLQKQKSAILLFHRVMPVRDKMWDPMDPALFEQTLKFVKKNFNTLPLNELLFSPPQASSKPLAAITFDDGYKDFADYAVPLLNKYSLPASMFIVTECVDKNLPTWTFVLDYLFEKTKKLSLDNFNFPELNNEFQKTKWINEEDRISYGKKFKQYLKWISSSVRSNVIDNLLLNFNDVKHPAGMMLTWNEIKQIKAAGFDIGSHSITHVTLATVEGNNELNSELIGSKRIIKERADIDTEIISYPCGNYDERVKSFSKNAGYKAGLAVDRQLYDAKKQDLFEVPRIELYNESWLKTKLRVNGTISMIEKYLRR
jgi:peptidoglycan/xylan/chitin deacetylase (PgdA/CDA1 family)